MAAAGGGSGSNPSPGGSGTNQGSSKGVYIAIVIVILILVGVDWIQRREEGVINPIPGTSGQTKVPVVKAEAPVSSTFFRKVNVDLDTGLSPIVRVLGDETIEFWGNSNLDVCTNVEGCVPYYKGIRLQSFSEIRFRARVGTSRVKYCVRPKGTPSDVCKD